MIEWLPLSNLDQVCLAVANFQVQMAGVHRPDVFGHGYMVAGGICLIT